MQRGRPCLRHANSSALLRTTARKRTDASWGEPRCQLTVSAAAASSQRHGADVTPAAPANRVRPRISAKAEITSMVSPVMGRQCCTPLRGRHRSGAVLPPGAGIAGIDGVQAAAYNLDGGTKQAAPSRRLPTVGCKHAGAAGAVLFTLGSGRFLTALTSQLMYCSVYRRLCGTVATGSPS
jgi:hypothetical protein